MLHLVLFFILTGVAFASERQLGVEYTGLDKLENEAIQSDCGKAVPISSDENPLKKILYGKTVTDVELMREAQWIVSITYSSPKGRGFCSGVLISPRHVLTAAHCQGVNETGTTCSRENFIHSPNFHFTDVSKHKVRLYSHKGHIKHEKAGETYTVKRVIFPASWTGGFDGGLFCNSYNGDTEDIAIYELEAPVSLPSFVCLANVRLPSKTLTNYGYGTTGLSNRNKEKFVLKKHNVIYMNCEDTDSTFPNGTECIRHATDKVTVACSGDSGSPVIGKYYNRTFTVGVFTTSFDCREVREDVEDGKNRVVDMEMASVPYYKNWICKWSGICVYGADPTKDKRPTAIWENTGEKRVL